MKYSRLRNLFIILGFLLALSAGFALAQAPGTDEGQPQSGDSITAILEDAIPIQGKLTNSSGVPLTGDHNVTFSLYNDPVAGNLLCSSNYNPLPLFNGLFNVIITGCDNTEIDGDQIYLGVQVDADGEMTPRQPIYAVPYARSMRPGADIRGDIVASSVLALYNSSTIDGSKGLYAEALGASGITYGVIGRSNSPEGFGGFFNNSAAAGVGLVTSAGNDNAADVVLGGNSSADDNGRLDSDPYFPGSDLLLVSNDKFHIHLDNNNDEVNSDFSILNGSNDTILAAEENGRLNLGIDAGGTTIITVGDRYHDNAIVAWAKVSYSGAISAEFGVTSVTKDPGLGSYLITIDASTAGASYLIPIAIAEIEALPNSPAGLRIVSINQETTTTFRVYINNGDGAPVDCDFVFMVTAR